MVAECDSEPAWALIKDDFEYATCILRDSYSTCILRDSYSTCILRDSYSAGAENRPSMDSLSHSAAKK